VASTVLTDESDNEFEVVFDDEKFITAVNGPWPSVGHEFTLSGVPSHRFPRDVPEVFQREALSRGEEVCYYDNDECRVCFCDGSGRVRCVKKC
jgi:hypothetical protein